MNLGDDENREWLRLAYKHALKSPDPSTQNGAVVLDKFGCLLGVGVNRFTDGMELTDDLFERPKKYSFIEHAERNAIYSCAKAPCLHRNGPHVMYAAWASCADCARGIVQSGIAVLVRHDRSGVDRWSESIDYGDQILKAAGIQVIDVHGSLGGCDPVLVNGELWSP